MSGPQISPRALRLDKIVADERMTNLLLALPVEVRGILVDILIIGSISPFYQRLMPYLVSDEDVRRYQFLRLIVNASDLYSVMDLVLDEVEESLETGVMP